MASVSHDTAKIEEVRAAILDNMHKSKCRLLKSSSLFDEYEDFIDSALIDICDILRII
jgi:hypothetical protein